MKLSPDCLYDPDPDESGVTCDKCGRSISYTHVVVSDIGEEIVLGVECVKILRRNGELDGKLPRNGRYDWTLSQVRARAKNDWLAAHPNSTI